MSERWYFLLVALPMPPTPYTSIPLYPPNHIKDIFGEVGVVTWTLGRRADHFPGVDVSGTLMADRVCHPGELEYVYSRHRRQACPSGATLAIDDNPQLGTLPMVTSTVVCFSSFLILLWHPQPKPLCRKDPGRNSALGKWNESSPSLF